MADTKPLAPFNENRWYVLMTQYGEHDWEQADGELQHKGNVVFNPFSSRE